MDLEARITLNLRATSMAPPMARQAGRVFEGAVDRAADLEILLSELVTNAVRHPDVGRDHSITVELFLYSDVLRVEVKDAGVGFRPPHSPRIEERAVGGWGLLLVDRVSDRWGMSSEPPNLVWSELDREAQASGDLVDEQDQAA